MIEIRPGKSRSAHEIRVSGLYYRYKTIGKTFVYEYTRLFLGLLTQASLLVIPDYPNHTQAVERAVKLTTEAAEKVVGFEQRHGMICQRIKARKQIPRFLSKKDALPMLEKP